MLLNERPQTPRHGSHELIPTAEFTFVEDEASHPYVAVTNEVVKDAKE